MSDDAVQGMEGLLSALDSLESLVTQKQIIVRALRVGGEVVRQRAEDLAPKRTGFLSEHMMITVTQQTSESAIAKVGPSRDAGYGTPEEYGSVHNSAQPFLRPAFDEKQDEATQAIGDTIAGEIAKELGV